MKAEPSRPDVAAAAKLALGRYIDEARKARPARYFGLNRQIAFVALYFAGDASLDPSAAVDVAAELYRDADVTYAYFRKCKSEARAVVEAVLGQGLLGTWSGGEQAVFTRIDEVLTEISVDQVTRRRAERLQGAKGGRRARQEMPVLHAVEQLARRARAGEPQARAELEAIARLLGEAARPVVTAAAAE